MLTVGLIYNVKEPNSSKTEDYLEWDEPRTIEKIKKALEEKAKVIKIEADKNLWTKLKKYKGQLDVVFNIAEGLNGAWREALVPFMLEELGIPYTGSDPTTLILCLDKERTKQILSCFNIKTPLYKVFSEVPELTTEQLTPLEFPLIVKPLREGSSKGIKNSSLVMGMKDCQNQIARTIQGYNQPVLVEEFIPGREFTVAILGNGEKIEALPVVEIDFSSLPKGAVPIYSYEAKWVWDVPSKPLEIFSCPAAVKPLIQERIKEVAINAYKAMGCRDWCRVDIRLNNQNVPYVLELNPIPGILPDARDNSCFPKAGRAVGWSYTQLVNIVLSITCERYGLKHESRKCSYNL